MIVVVLLFIAATFLTQVTIFNMLIAIMGDTFGKVTEIKEQSGLKEKINILADYVWIIPDESGNRSRYVYSMQPKTQTEEESNGWEGQVTSIKSVVQNSSKTMRNETKRDISSVQNEVANTQKAVK